MHRLIAVAPLAALVAGASLAIPSRRLDTTIPARRAFSVPRSGARHRLVAWWRGNGNARESVDHHTGVREGAVTFGPGVAGQAFHFLRAGAFVRVPRAPDLDPRTGVSLDFWMKGDPGNTMTACCQGLVTTDFYGVELSGGFSTRVGINFFVSTDNGASFHHTSDVIGGSFRITSGEWVHVLGSYNGAILKLYVNGRLYAQTPWHGVISPMRPTSFLSIGSEDGRTYNKTLVGARYFRGSVDEVKLYNYAIK